MSLDQTTSSALRQPSEIVRNARLMLGTPFRHQGRQPGVGIDCLGLVVCSIGGRARELDETDYAGVPDSIRLQVALDRHFKLLDAGSIHDAPAGAILSFAVYGDPHRGARHLGIKSDRGMIHARHGARNAVVEVPISDAWSDLFLKAYEWRAQ